MSSKAAEVPQNLPEARKQANSDGDTSPVSLSQAVSLTPLANSKNLFLSTAKMYLKEMWGRSWQEGRMEDWIFWSRAMVQAGRFLKLVPWKASSGRIKHNLKQVLRCCSLVNFKRPQKKKSQYVKNITIWQSLFCVTYFFPLSFLELIILYQHQHFTNPEPPHFQKGNGHVYIATVFSN